MTDKYKVLIEKIKGGDTAKSFNEYHQYIEFFTDEEMQEVRFQLYSGKMKEKGLANLAEAKHVLLKQIFEDFIQAALNTANTQAKNKSPSNAKKIVDQIARLRDVFKNHDVSDYKDFITQSDSNINEVEVELLFLEPQLNFRELDKLTNAFVKAFKKKTSLSQNKTEFQRKFFSHPLMQCLDAYSDFKTIQKHIEEDTVSLGKYKNLIQSMLGLREKVNAEEYQGFITFVIHEDLTYGLANILKDERYNPSYLRDLLIEMADGKPLENKTIKELISQIKINHTKNLALNTRKELVTHISSIASLNDYGFDVNIKNQNTPIIFHGHSTENAGANQREQQANTAFTIRGFGMDTIGLTVLKDEITRTDHHSNFMKDFSHMIFLSRTEELILSGLQFDASNFKSLALNGSLQSLKDGDFLASNHYIVKADITRSQKIINNNLGKTDLELVCEKKNAYMSIVGKNKDLFKSVIETTSTNNQLSFQLFSKPFVEFIEATLLVEEETKIKVFTNEEIGLMEEILSVRGHNLELETAKKKCLRSINQRDVENYADVKSHSHTSLSFIGLLDREVINRFENQRKEKSREHVKFFKDANHTLEDCLEYLENNPLNSREYLKGYKNKVVEALKEKILSSANERLNYKSEQKEELLSGIKEITDNLNEGTDIIFTKEDMRLSASKFGSRKALAKLINGKEPRDGQRSENLSIIIGILSLANLCGAKLIMKSKMAKGYIDEKREVSELTEEDIKYFKEQEDKSRRVKA
jgi:hypothetical protein